MIHKQRLIRNISKYSPALLDETLIAGQFSITRLIKICIYIQPNITPMEHMTGDYEYRIERALVNTYYSEFVRNNVELINNVILWKQL